MLVRKTFSLRAAVHAGYSQCVHDSGIGDGEACEHGRDLKAPALQAGKGWAVWIVCNLNQALCLLARVSLYSNLSV